MSSKFVAIALASALSLLTGHSLGDIVLSGVVRDGSTELPIAEAIVTLQATTIRATTGPDGSYSLTIPDTDSATIVAAYQGYYNQSALYNSGDSTTIDISIPMVPHGDDPSYQFRTPQSCSVCHPKQYEQWTDSPMAKAGLNTWVHDIFNGTGTPGGMGGFVYTRDSVFSETNPSSECASCHQPEPWIEDPFSRMENPTDPGYPSIGTVHGISCETCHKIAEVDVAKINFPGIFPGAVEFTRPEGPLYNQVMYGLLGDVDFSLPTTMRGSYNPQLAAETCGSCHQDAADPDENHSYTGVISEPTYLEWAGSSYSDPKSEHYASCVDCHMPAEKDTQVSILMDLGREFGTVRNHRILGTTPEFLENAAEMTIESSTVGSQLSIDVSIFNKYTGHHLPTGVTVRNMILVVEAFDDTTGSPLAFTGDQVIHDLGGIGDPSQGYYAGMPGRYFGKVNHDANGNGPTFFTDATGITFDNRIPALETDHSNYTFEVPANAQVRVQARLIYRRAFRSLVDAKSWTQDGHGNPLADVAAPHYGHLMEHYDATIAVCTADLSNDGLLDFFDVSDFLDAFGAHAPAADFDGNGLFDFFDVSAFLDAFGSGCP